MQSCGPPGIEFETNGLTEPQLTGLFLFLFGKKNNLHILVGL